SQEGRWTAAGNSHDRPCTPGRIILLLYRNFVCHLEEVVDKHGGKADQGMVSPVVVGLRGLFESLPQVCFQHLLCDVGRKPGQDVRPRLDTLNPGSCSVRALEYGRLPLRRKALGKGEECLKAARVIRNFVCDVECVIDERSSKAGGE